MKQLPNCFLKLLFLSSVFFAIVKSSKVAKSSLLLFQPFNTSNATNTSLTLNASNRTGETVTPGVYTATTVEEEIRNSNDISKNIFTAIGSCKSIITPDTFKIKVQIVETKPTAIEAFAAEEETYAKTLNSVVSLGMKNITINEIGKNVDMVFTNNQTLFSVKRLCEIVIEDEESAGKFIDIANKMNPLLIQSIDYDISEKLKNKEIAKCIGPAISNAQERILRMALDQNLVINPKTANISINLNSAQIQSTISNNIFDLPASELNVEVTVVARADIPEVPPVLNIN